MPRASMYGMTHAVKSEWNMRSGKKGFQSDWCFSPRLRPDVENVMTGSMRKWITTTPTRTGWAKNPAQLPHAMTMRRRKKQTLSGMPISCLIEVDLDMMPLRFATETTPGTP